MKTIYQINPLTKKTKDWIEKNLLIDGWQKDTYCVTVEWRYIQNIYKGLTEDGLKNKIDYLIY